MSKISLLVVEDHEVYSIVLRDLLSKDKNLQIVGVVPTAEEALGMLDHFRIDLVLIDIGLPRIDGITLAQLIRDKNPTIPCLMLSGYLSQDYVQKSIRAGARGYLLKDNSSEILKGILSVINGGTYFSKGLGQIYPDPPQGE